MTILPTPPAGWPSMVTQALSEILSRIIERLNVTQLRTVGAGRISLVPTNMDLISEVVMDGTVYLQADLPELYAAIGTQFNTGGEAGNEFRVPNYVSPGAGSEYRISIGL